MRYPHSRVLGALLLTSLVQAACDRAKPGGPGDPVGTADLVAKVGDTEITAADFEEHLRQQPTTTREHYTAPENRAEYLDRMIRFEVLAREAQARGYDKDPTVQRIMKQQMVELLVKVEVDAKLKPSDVPAADVEAYYRDRAAEFGQPEQVRVHQILVRDREVARSVLERARRDRSAAGFSALAGELSQDDSRSRGGDLGWLARGTALYPASVVEAAFSGNPGDVLGPVQSDRGWHILRVAERRSGGTKPLAEVRDEIQRRLFTHLRGRRMEELVASLQEGTKIERYPQRLANSAAPARPSGSTAR